MTACKDVPLQTVERYNLLKQFVDMLPQSSQIVHDSAVLARRHVEYYDPEVMVQVLSQVQLLLVLSYAVLCKIVSTCYAVYVPLMTVLCMFCILEFCGFKLVQ